MRTNLRVEATGDDVFTLDVFEMPLMFVND